MELTLTESEMEKILLDHVKTKIKLDLNACKIDSEYGSIKNVKFFVEEALSDFQKLEIALAALSRISQPANAGCGNAGAMRDIASDALAEIYKE